MDLGLKDKVVVITGASRGLGRGMALAFAGEGCHVALLATSAERAAPVAAEAEALGVKARAYGCDIADHASVQQVAATILKDFGTIDVLINNAGMTKDGLFLRMSEDDWDRVLDVNLKGAFNTCRAFAKTIIRRPSARIINISSIVGISGNAGQANYAASKGALISFTKSLAKELAARQVCVNAIAPGFIETDMTSALSDDVRDVMRREIPLQRFGSDADIASAALFLAGSTGSYITGQTFVIDGGMAI